jgi:hypothetical protein
MDDEDLQCIFLAFVKVDENLQWTMCGIFEVHLISTVNSDNKGVLVNAI